MAREATARRTDGLSGWLRTALPAAVIDAPDEAHGRRDHVVDAVTYVLAFVIGAATLADTWAQHPPWLRVVAIVVGVAALVSLHWRRTHPAAVGIGTGAVSVVIISASGANLAAAFNAAIRARGRDLAIIAGLLIAWAFVNPLVYPPDPDHAPVGDSYWFDVGASLLMAGVVIGWGLFVRARRELVRSLRDQAGRAGEEARAAERRRIAREMHDVLAHRLSLLSVHAGALEFHPDAPPEEVAAAAGVIRESARSALDELARRDRRPARGRRRQPDAAAAADARRPPRARRGVARGRDAADRADRAGRGRARPPRSAAPPTGSCRRG